MSLSFGSFQLYSWKTLYKRYLSLVACTLPPLPPSKFIVHSRMTCDSDVCEVDLDIQTSFLNAALFHTSRGASKRFAECCEKRTDFLTLKTKSIGQVNAKPLILL